MHCSGDRDEQRVEHDGGEASRAPRRRERGDCFEGAQAHSGVLDGSGGACPLWRRRAAPLWRTPSSTERRGRGAYACYTQTPKAAAEEQRQGRGGGVDREGGGGDGDGAGGCETGKNSPSCI